MKAILITILTAICLTLTGCGAKQEDYDKLKQENASLSQQISDITSECNQIKLEFAKVVEERNELKRKLADLEAKQTSNQQTSSKPIATGSVITDFSDLTRRVKSYKGQTVTVEGKIYATYGTDFTLRDKNILLLHIDAKPADYEIMEEDLVRVTGIVQGLYCGNPVIGHVTSIQRI